MVGLVQAGEPELFTFAVSGHAPGDIVLITQYGAAGWLLPKQNVAFGINILLHILVVVQVVGVTLVTTATLGLLRMLISWKLESSTTAISAGVTSGSWGSRAAPMLPPRNTLRPAASNILAIRVVVVVLPSEPVTATISQGHSSKEFYLAGHKRTGLFGGLQLRLKEFIAGVRMMISCPAKPSV